MRVMVGRTLSVTSSEAEICGVTLITKPTGTVCSDDSYTAGVVTVLFRPSTAGVTLIEKNTLLSTTLSSAVWLFSTLIFGLDKTLTLPNDSSNWMVVAILPRREVALAKLSTKIPGEVPGLTVEGSVLLPTWPW